MVEEFVTTMEIIRAYDSFYHVLEKTGMGKEDLEKMKKEKWISAEEHDKAIDQWRQSEEALLDKTAMGVLLKMRNKQYIELEKKYDKLKEEYDDILNELKELGEKYEGI